MLIEFNVSNYRSFKHEQCFSMETGKRLRKYKNTNTFEKNNVKLLKSALLFGANANGKTNLIKALDTLKSLITNPTVAEIQKLPTDTFGYNNHDTKFEITFTQRKKKYKYLIKYNRKEISEELLAVNDEVVFERKGQNFKKVPSKIYNLTGNIRKNQLLLYYSQQNNEEHSKNVYKWFVDNLILINTNEIQSTKFQMLKNKKFKENFLYFLQAADFNIIDVDVKERTAENESLNFLIDKLREVSEDNENIHFNKNSNPKTFYDVYSTHESEKNNFNVYFKNESTGTKVFMILALYILSNSDKTLLIDEFDRSYHLELAQSLLSLINSKEQTNQFILTSHELSLMNCRLRQDQIWFAEKNRYGESNLFSLFDFDDPALTRHDANYKKRYLEGIYGATQIIDSKLLKEALKDSE